LTGTLGQEDGEDLVGSLEPGLDEPRLLWLAASQCGIADNIWVVEAAAIPVQEEQRVKNGVRHRLAAGLIRIGDLEALLDEPCDEVRGGSAVGLVVEHRVPRLVPGVGAGPGVLPGLGLECIEAIDLEGRNTVLLKVLVLVVAEDDDEVCVTGAMVPRVRCSLAAGQDKMRR
jgi:hypothetical protein